VEQHRRPSPQRAETGVTTPNQVAPRQLVVVWGDELAAFGLPEAGSVRIGRADDNDIRIDHDSVSRWHAVLHVGATLVVEDLGAANGTFVPDPTHQRRASETRQLRRLARSVAEVAIGDNLIFGAVSAVIRREPDTYGADAVSQSGLVRGVAPEGNMHALQAQAALAARSSISVLILGETGVGKEVMARSIHALSPRASRTFLGFNCAGFGEHVLEGELFGYERGAFTGATEARPGLFEAADGGTVFLDEVGELSLSTQAKLLRLLETRAVLRIGARKERAVDVRFVAATNRDLEALVAIGEFRRDLFYRLNGISLTIPPLRARLTELEPLTRGFVTEACRQLERPPLGIADDALQALAAHDWPGNVRELKNAIERAAVLCAEDVIRREHLPSVIALTRRPDPAPVAEGQSEPKVALLAAELDPERFAAQLAALERARIVDALDKTGGNQTEAAKLLGMARRTLIARLDVLQLPRPRKRSS
jgi:two-component system, NtrC family, response regulator AtoC